MHTYSDRVTHIKKHFSCIFTHSLSLSLSLVSLTLLLPLAHDDEVGSKPIKMMLDAVEPVARSALLRGVKVDRFVLPHHHQLPFAQRAANSSTESLTIHDQCMTMQHRFT